MSEIYRKISLTSSLSFSPPPHPYCELHTDIYWAIILYKSLAKVLKIKQQSDFDTDFKSLEPKN